MKWPWSKKTSAQWWAEHTWQACLEAKLKSKVLWFSTYVPIGFFLLSVNKVFVSVGLNAPSTTPQFLHLWDWKGIIRPISEQLCYAHASLARFSNITITAFMTCDHYAPCGYLKHIYAWVIKCTCKSSSALSPPSLLNISKIINDFI